MGLNSNIPFLGMAIALQSAIKIFGGKPIPER